MGKPSRTLFRFSSYLAVAGLATAMNACSPRTNTSQDSSTPIDDPTAHEKVIYGDDNRHDYYMEKDPKVRMLADSTVALIAKSSLSSSGQGTVAIAGEPYGKTYGLCESEPFWDQDAAAFCSGFLVAPDIIVTAGHCITNAKECAAAAMVFGYAYKTPTVAPNAVPESDVYSCKRVIRSESAAAGADFAVIQLDRPVLGHTPIALRKQGSVQVGDDLFVIGHPTGLPTKIADGAKVRTSKNRSFFVANLDTFGGNSGSAVFNARTLEVEGVLVRGEQDFKWGAGRCMVSYPCTDSACRGEDVTRISEVLGWLPTSLQ